MTLRAHWVTLRARWVTLRDRWETLRARWVTLTAEKGDGGTHPNAIAMGASLLAGVSSSMAVAPLVRVRGSSVAGRVCNRVHS